jgi:hypothetical protein
MKKIIFCSALMLGIAGSVSAQWTHNWSRTFGGAGGSTGNEQGRCVTHTGNTTTSAGIFFGTTDFNPDPGLTNNRTASGLNQDIYILQFDAAGTFSWVNQISGAGFENPECIKMDPTSTIIYVCGRFTGTANFNVAGTALNKTSLGGDDLFIASYDATTGLLINVITAGSTGADDAWDMDVDQASGDILVTGSFTGTVNFNPSGTTNRISAGGRDIYYARYNASLTSLVWVRSVGGTGGDLGYGICIGNGMLFVCGNFQGTADFDPSPSLFTQTAVGSTDLFFARYDLTTGAFISGASWVRRAGSTSGSQDARDIAWSSVANAVYVTGALRTGTVTFTGGGPAYPVAGSSDAFLVCYNTAGTYMWGNGFGSVSPDFGLDICTDDVVNSFSTGYVYVCGFFSATVDFDISGSTTSAISAGASDGFLLRYNSGGTFKNVSQFGGTANDQCAGLDADRMSQYAYITGFFRGSGVDFDPSGGGFALHSSSVGDDAFHNRYSWTAPLRLQNPNTETAFTPSTNVYPNPANDFITIENLEEGTIIELYTMGGQKAGYWQQTGNDKMNIETNEFENGIYLLNITKADGTVENKKIVIQH